jgi:hypothetical protein
MSTMTAETGTTTAPTVNTDRRAAFPPVAAGAVGGLAWAAGFRGFMVEIAGPSSAVEWTGTFVGILLPGVVTGALRGWAEHLRRTGGRRGWRWLALAPLVFVAATPSVLVSIFADGGIGGGALAVPLFAMVGGYALSGRGRTWTRAAAGFVALAPIVGWAAAAGAIDGDRFALDSPRGAWVALLFSSFVVVLALGCAVPHRAVIRRAELVGSRPAGEAEPDAPRFSDSDHTLDHPPSDIVSRS